MLFTKFNLDYFGRFHNREIDLKPGINLIYGENEAGKSTIHTFIKGMLFGIERLRGRGSASKEDLYTRYLPWDYPGAFSGSMDLQIGDKEYRLQRSFHAADKNFTLVDLSTGRVVKLKEGLISDLVPGLSEAAFKNTISIEQLKAQTDTELAAQVRNYITNLSITKSKEVNVAKALSSLTEQKKALEASQGTAVLKALQAEIEEGLEREEKIDSLTLQLQSLQAEEQELKAKKDAAANTPDSKEVKQMEQLPAILEKYRSYQELTRQSTQLSRQKAELREKITAWEAERQTADSLKEDLKTVEKLNTEIQEYEKKQQELINEKGSSFQGLKKKNLLLCSIPVIAIILLSVAFTGSFLIGIVIACMAALCGGIGYSVLNKSVNLKHKQFNDELNLIIKQISAAKARINDILKRYQVSVVQELSAKYEEILKHYYVLEQSKEQLKDLEHRGNEAEDNRDLMYDSIMKYLRGYVAADDLTEASINALQQVIRQRKQDLLQKQTEMNHQYEACRLRIEKLKWEITAMEGNEVQLLKNKERYAELEQKRKEDAVELEAVKLALGTIQTLTVDIHDSFGLKLNAAVSEIIGEVTGSRYTDIKVDEKLDVKVGWNGNYVLLDKLSAGTIDQIYFALRLAVADLLLGRDEVPLLLDDSFALYDDNRVRAALTKIADRNQIILFSCHKREKRLLEELNIPYHFIDLSEC